MPLQIKVQFDIIVYAMLAGILTGIIFDLYRIVRGKKVPKFIMIFEDILFWIFASISVFAFLLYTNYAFLGLYEYVFIISILILYLKLLSPKVFNLEMKIINKISFCLRIVFKRLIYIFKVIYYSISGKINTK